MRAPRGRLDGSDMRAPVRLFDKVTLEDLRMFYEIPGFECLIPQRGPGLLEPLFAVYAKSALPAIRRLLASGERSVRALFPLVRMKTLDMGDASWFTNINTVEDYRAFLSRASGRQ